MCINIIVLIIIVVIITFIVIFNAVVTTNVMVRMAVFRLVSMLESWYNIANLYLF